MASGTVSKTPVNKLAARLWLGFFFIWLVLLTGVGAPGLWQHLRLHGTLSDKQAELAAVETETQALLAEEKLLKEDPATQEFEIRKTLGYAAADELLFDF
jgi:cell division protein FtsB